MNWLEWFGVAFVVQVFAVLCLCATAWASFGKWRNSEKEANTPRYYWQKPYHQWHNGR